VAPGRLDWTLDLDRLVAQPVLDALAGWPRAGEVRAAPIDPELADTAAFCAAYGYDTGDSANTIIVETRDNPPVYAACVVLATTRADVNGLVRRHLDARKASFAAMDVAVAETGMEYGGITPVGLPESWPVLVDDQVAKLPSVIIGAGIRGAKLRLPGSLLAELPSGEVLPGLGVAVG